MSLTIDRVRTDKQLREFTAFVWQVYEDDPHWVPWLYHDRLHAFNRRKHPLFHHTEADFFIARRDGRAVGTIAALLNHRHNEFHEENVAHFGVFEVLPDQEAALALLKTACEWARMQGVDKILGPMNLSTNDECGLLTDGFDSPPIIMMTYNPPYYVNFIETAGFTKTIDLWAYRADVHELAENMPTKVLRVIDRVKKRYRLSLRQLDLNDWDNEVERVKRIYNSAWARNWGFVPMTEAEFDHLAHNLKPILDPSIAFIVEQEGEPVGFSLSLPNANEALHQIKPRPSILSSYLSAGYALLRKGHYNWLRVLVLGVIEPYRAKGIDAMLYYETAVAAKEQGYKWAEGSWILENNVMMNRALQMLGAEVYKTYRIYEKEV